MLKTFQEAILNLLGYTTLMVSDTLLKTDNNFSLDGMIAPRFHNEGDTDVIIHNITVRPGEMFNCSATIIPMSGRIPIIIKEGANSKLVCIYNTIVKKQC
ncbi:hypothetical protein [Aquimarina litoralis]|uniref:hypothetical protein n=1 Tax=Aquimarina litoralis TaxID=584605 RepID=UPI001C57FAE8|nr:hypothetical protein [Aquimarina litoralis]MBW1296434.1 hypothetical protein [Aquimarina litoralis]